MLGREIQLDPSLTRKFFEFKEEKDLTVNVSFPLPSLPTELPEFLESDENKQSLRSKQFKVGFVTSIDALSSWAKSNHIDPSPCERFKNNYLGYSGSNLEKNKLDFSIYKEGVAALVGIVKHINDDNLPFDNRKTVIQDLLTKLNVCGPGAYTSIMNAYLELIGLSNGPIYWMKLRRSIAEQAVLFLLKDKNIQEGMEIHYVNAVLNRFADDISIIMIEDDYAANCDPDILNLLFDQFKAIIPTKLTLLNLIDLASDDEAFTNLSARLESVSHDVYRANMNKIKSTLARFGLEAPDKQFFSNEQKIIRLYGEFSDKIVVDWKAYYIIFLSIYSRLLHNGQVNPFPHEESKNVNLRFIKKTRRNMPGEVESMSFIGHIVEVLASNDSPHKQHYLNTIFSDIYTHQHRVEIAIGIARFLSSTYAKLVLQEKKDALFSLLPRLLSTNLNNFAVDDIIAFFPFLPSSLQLAFWNIIHPQIIIENINQLNQLIAAMPTTMLPTVIDSLHSHLLNLIKKSNDLDSVLTNLGSSRKLKTRIIELLNHPSHNNNLLNIVQDCESLTAVLEHFNFKRIVTADYFNLNTNTFMSLFGDDILNIMKDKKNMIFHTSDDVLIIVSSLPIYKRLPFINSLGDDFLKPIMNTGLFSDILNILNPGDQSKEFFVRFNDCLIMTSEVRARDLITIAKFIEDNDDRRRFIAYHLPRILQGLTLENCDLVNLLELVPKTKRIEIIEKIPQQTIKNLFVDPNISLDGFELYLNIIEDLLPEDHRLTFITRILQVDGSFLSNFSCILQAFDSLPSNDHKMILLDHLDDLLNGYSYDIKDKTSLNEALVNYCTSESEIYDPNNIDHIQINQFIHQKILDQLLRQAPIASLELAYDHDYFKKVDPSLNKPNPATLFSSNANINETPNQRLIRERIEELQRLEKKRKLDENPNPDSDEPAAKRPRGLND